MASNVDHVINMPLLSAGGRACNPLILLQGKHTKYLVMEDGSTVPPVSSLPQNAFITYRNPASVDGAIFGEWLDRFIIQTQLLRDKYKNTVLTLDEYVVHAIFNAFQNVKDNNIIAFVLPAHGQHIRAIAHNFWITFCFPRLKNTLKFF